MFNLAMERTLMKITLKCDVIVTSQCYPRLTNIVLSISGDWRGFHCGIICVIILILLVHQKRLAIGDRLGEFTASLLLVLLTLMLMMMIMSCDLAGVEACSFGRT